MASSPTPPFPTRRAGVALPITAVALFSFGLTLLVLSATYLRDLAVLANAPFLVWSALCGQPIDSPLTVPLLVSLSMLAVLMGVALLILYIIKGRRHADR
jgi:hypothetical protein